MQSSILSLTKLRVLSDKGSESGNPPRKPTHVVLAINVIDKPTVRLGAVTPVALWLSANHEVFKAEADFASDCKQNKEDDTIQGARTANWNRSLQGKQKMDG